MNRAAAITAILVCSALAYISGAAFGLPKPHSGAETAIQTLVHGLQPGQVGSLNLEGELSVPEIEAFYPETPDAALMMIRFRQKRTAALASALIQFKNPEVQRLACQQAQMEFRSEAIAAEIIRRSEVSHEATFKMLNNPDTDHRQ